MQEPEIERGIVKPKKTMSLFFIIEICRWTQLRWIWHAINITSNEILFHIMFIGLSGEDSGCWNKNASNSSSARIGRRNARLAAVSLASCVER
jgi:hypothetical protein